MKKELEQATAAEGGRREGPRREAGAARRGSRQGEGLKAEAKALAVEKKRSDAGRGGLASAAKPGS